MHATFNPRNALKPTIFAISVALELHGEVVPERGNMTLPNPHSRNLRREELLKFFGITDLTYNEE